MSSARQLPFAPSGGKARRDARRVDHALRRAGTYPHPAGRIRRIETHMSVVFLAGRYAYKVFKPVKFDFADLTRPARRRRCAQAECTLNRALAEADVFDYIERFYNPNRRHSTLNFLCPVQFEQRITG